MLTAVDEEDLARDEVALEQEQDRARHVLRLAVALERQPVRETREVRLVLAGRRRMSPGATALTESPGANATAAIRVISARRCLLRM